LEVKLAELREPHLVWRRRLYHPFAHQNLTGARPASDAGGEVHRSPEVVSTVGHHRTGRHSHMGRRQAGPRHLLNHLHRRADGTPRISEVEHHAVTEPLDRSTTVAAGRPLDHFAQGGGEFRGDLIAPLLGQPRIAHEVQEHHGRNPFRSGEHPGFLERRFDVLDLVLGPHQLLLASVRGHQGPIHQGNPFVGHPGGPLDGLPLTQPSLEGRHLEAGMVDLGLGHDRLLKALGVGPSDPGHPGLVEHPGGDRLADQGNDLELILPDPVVGLHPGIAVGLEDGTEHLEGDTCFPARLTVGSAGALGPPTVRRSLQEREGDAALLDGLPDALHGEARPLARLGQSDLLHVAGDERPAATSRHQDAQGHHPLELALGSLSALRELGGGESVALWFVCHALVILPVWNTDVVAVCEERITNEDTMSLDQRSWLSRIGAVCAIVGALSAAVGNLLHPVTPRDDPMGVAQVIARSDAWTLIHVVIVFGVILMFLGLVAIGYSIEGGVAGALARLGVYAAAVGTTLGLATVILDGVGAKQLADQWAVAPEATKTLALRLVSTNETLNFALAGMFNLAFAGVPFILFGLAVALNGVYPRWLGWVAAIAGVGSVAAGLVQAFTGEPTVASLVLTIIGPTIISLWVLVMGVLMVRRTTRSRP
jgi:hypothetical protein